MIEWINIKYFVTRRGLTLEDGNMVRPPPLQSDYLVRYVVIVIFLILTMIDMFILVKASRNKIYVKQFAVRFIDDSMAVIVTSSILFLSTRLRE